jgi:hypothetical protein
MGSSWSPDLESQGVIPSVMDEMFTRIEVESNTDFVVKVSFVEIHKVRSEHCSSRHVSRWVQNSANMATLQCSSQQQIEPQQQKQHSACVLLCCQL